MKSSEKEALVHECLVKNYGQYYKIADSYTFHEQDAMDVVQEGAYRAILKSDSLKLARPALERNGILHYFDFLLDCHIAGAEKTSPNIYLMAAERFRARPGDCVVIEDSAYAIRTAREAGFWTIGVYEPEMQDADLARSFCHQFVNNLGEIRPGYLET